MRRFLSISLLALLALWGCGEGDGQLAVSLTDAATDQYNAVYVTIIEVQVHKSADAEESESGWITVATPGKTFDLLELQNGVREHLGLATLSSGQYQQMRLLLGPTPDDGINILSELHPFGNYVVDTDNIVHELKVPSGFQTGIKIVGGFEVSEETTTEVVLDFVASESVVIAGNSGQYLLKPTIKILEVHEASIINGTVTDASDDSAIAGATVQAQMGEVDVRASDETDSDGHYELFVSPDTYNVVATHEGFGTDVAGVTVSAGEVATQDFSLEATETGELSGAVSITNGLPQKFVTISIRQHVTVDGNAEVIEVASLDIQNGDNYSIILPVGEYEIVATSFEATPVVISNVMLTSGGTTQDITLVAF